MESITLQVGNSVVNTNDLIGQLQFAAPSESDGGAATYIVGRIYSQAEGAFTSVSNPASVIIATSAADSSPATGRLKISHEGHVLPMADDTYDLGSATYRFRNLYSSTAVVSPEGSFETIFFDTTQADVDQVTGQLNWNDTLGTLDLGLTDTLTTHLGQDVFYRVINFSGGTIYQGQAVYASGVNAGGQRIEITKFVADGSIDEVRYIGLLAETLDNGDTGYVVHFGHVRKVDLRSSNTALNPNAETWAAGDILFPDDSTAGGLTKVPPQDIIYTAIVLADGQNGELLVRTTDHGHISDLHDVSVTGLADNNFLVYDSSSGLWQPSTDLFYVSGDLGIGTSTPSGALHVVGEAYVDNLKLDGNTLSTTNTNGALILNPNGTGALQADSGGNARGAYATDLQRARSVSSQVASGACSVVVGGRGNTASSIYTVAVGGRFSSASANYATVVGGNANAAGGTGSFVGGGITNNASGSRSVVSGGRSNTASGSYSTVGGGGYNIASTIYSTVGGGCGNSASGGYSTVSGGSFNTASGYYSTIGGGFVNTASGWYSTVGGGIVNCASGTRSTVGGGLGNCASGCNSSISGGCYNITNARHSTINGGHRNIIQSPTNECCSRGVTIGGGVGHNSSGGTLNSTTGDLTGTITCCNAGAFSTIGGGLRNIAIGACSTIGGGCCNTANGLRSSILGGGSNHTCGYCNAHIIGSNICATQADTTYTENIISAGDVTISGHLSASTKSFLINHPSREGHKLQYGSLESPYHGVRLTGKSKVDNGWCVVKLPEYIKDLVSEEDVNIQITNYQHSVLLYVSDIDVNANEFKVKTDSWFKRNGLEFFWSFTAVRKDIAPLKVEY